MTCRGFSYSCYIKKYPFLKIIERLVLLQISIDITYMFCNYYLIRDIEMSYFELKVTVTFKLLFIQEKTLNCSCQMHLEKDK